MDKEDAISLGRHISHIKRHMRMFITRELEPLGIRGCHYGYLMYLSHNEGVSQEELTEHMMVDKATTARAIGKLEELGYIRRTRDERDRRVYHVHLTEKGSSSGPRIREVLDRWAEIMLKDFTRDERDMMIRFLRRIEENSRGITA